MHFREKVEGKPQYFRVAPHLQNIIAIILKPYIVSKATVTVDPVVSQFLTTFL